MSPQHRSLLEAFKQGGPTVPTTAAPAPKASSAPVPSLLAGATSTHAPSGSRLAFWVLLQFVALVTAFVIGRASVQRGVTAGAPTDDEARLEQRSSGDSAPSANPPPALTQPAASPSVGNASSGNPSSQSPSGESQPAQNQLQIDATPRNAAELALTDKRNVYTIKLVEYSNTEANAKLAREALRYLRDDQGLPACLAGTGSRLYILVGAAPAQVDFDALLKRVKQMKGPPPASRPAEFHDAYLEKIDKVFQRK